MAASILFVVPPAEGALMRGSLAKTVPRRRSRPHSLGARTCGQPALASGIIVTAWRDADASPHSLLPTLLNDSALSLNARLLLAPHELAVALA